jgi:hypothetical protein
VAQRAPWVGAPEGERRCLQPKQDGPDGRDRPRRRDGRPGGGGPTSSGRRPGRSPSDRGAAGGRRTRDDRPRSSADRSGTSDGRGPRDDRRGSGRDRQARDERSEGRGAQRLVRTTPRLPDPAIAEGVTGRELDRSVRQQLRTLSKENADGVAQHLVMVGLLLEADDLVGAEAHAETAVRRAGRVPAAREALGMVAYRKGDWARALSEFRTVRRLSGSAHLLPLMVDCERGLGRPERALELASSPDADTLDADERVELLIVTAGIRRDLGQLDAAVVTLEVPALTGRVRPYSPRLFYAYADALLARGDDERAREWFVRTLEVDDDLQTDAADRLNELDGIVVEEVMEDAVDDTDAD